jgi:hypothetical protein
MIVKQVPHYDEGNANYPLPADYDGLTNEGRRAARVNACRQWTLHTPQASDAPKVKRAMWWRKADALVAGLDLWERYYLTADGDFNPMFFEGQAIPRPKFHDHITVARVIYHYVAAVAPRGGAKTFYWKKSVPFQMVSHPGYSFLYCSSTQDLSTVFGDDTKYLLTNNERVLADWAPEYGGAIVGKRGEVRSGMSDFVLTNRSWLFCTSAEARKRGKRPVEIVIDDAEWDPTATSSREQMRENFDRMMRYQLLPMITGQGTRCSYVGTYIDQQAYLWHIMETTTATDPETGKEIEVAVDKTFDAWFRIHQPAASHVKQEDGTSKLVSCWPHRWPADTAEKSELGLFDDTKTLDEVRLLMGDAPFEAEMLGNPGGAAGTVFGVLEKDKHGYWFEGNDADAFNAPWKSPTLICWWRQPLGKAQIPQLVKMPLTEFCERFPRFLTCDTSKTSGSHSDWKVAHCMALTDFNELFSLGLWGAQAEQSDLVTNAISMAVLWRAAVIGVEAIEDGIGVVQDLLEVVRTRAVKEFEGEHLPEIMGFNPGRTSKCAKIAGAITFRMQFGLYKFPWMYRYAHDTVWPRLAEQIQGFKNLGGDNTGLNKDDFLDTLSMNRFVVSGLPSEQDAAEEDETNVIERLKQGERLSHDELMLALATMSPADAAVISARRRSPPKDPRGAA